MIIEWNEIKNKAKQKITMIKWKEYIKNIHNNNIKNDQILK